MIGLDDEMVGNNIKKIYKVLLTLEGRVDRVTKYANGSYIVHYTYMLKEDPHPYIGHTVLIPKDLEDAYEL